MKNRTPSEALALLAFVVVFAWGWVVERVGPLLPAESTRSRAKQRATAMWGSGRQFAAPATALLIAAATGVARLARAAGRWLCADDGGLRIARGWAVRQTEHTADVAGGITAAAHWGARALVYDLRESPWVGAAFSAVPRPVRWPQSFGNGIAAAVHGTPAVLFFDLRRRPWAGAAFRAVPRPLHWPGLVLSGLWAIVRWAFAALLLCVRRSAGWLLRGEMGTFAPAPVIYTATLIVAVVAAASGYEYVVKDHQSQLVGAYSSANVVRHAIEAEPLIPHDTTARPAEPMQFQESGAEGKLPEIGRRAVLLLCRRFGLAPLDGREPDGFGELHRALQRAAEWEYVNLEGHTAGVLKYLMDRPTCGAVADLVRVLGAEEQDPKSEEEWRAVSDQDACKIAQDLARLTPLSRADADGPATSIAATHWYEWVWRNGTEAPGVPWDGSPAVPEASAILARQIDRLLQGERAKSKLDEKIVPKDKKEELEQAHVERVNRFSPLLDAKSAAGGGDAERRALDDPENPNPAYSPEGVRLIAGFLEAMLTRTHDLQSVPVPVSKPAAEPGAAEPGPAALRGRLAILRGGIQFWIAVAVLWALLLIACRTVRRVAYDILGVPSLSPFSHPLGQAEKWVLGPRGADGADAEDIRARNRSSRWLLRFLAGAIPALGFIGTVLGISDGLSGGGRNRDRRDPRRPIGGRLGSRRPTRGGLHNDACRTGHRPANRPSFPMAADERRTSSAAAVRPRHGRRRKRLQQRGRRGSGAGGGMNGPQRPRSDRPERDGVVGAVPQISGASVGRRTRRGNPVDEDNGLSTSFLDVLCCGLGGATLLFLVFATLPHLGSRVGVRVPRWSGGDDREGLVGVRLDERRGVQQVATTDVEVWGPGGDAVECQLSAATLTGFRRAIIVDGDRGEYRRFILSERPPQGGADLGLPNCDGQLQVVIRPAGCPPHVWTIPKGKHQLRLWLDQPEQGWLQLRDGTRLQRDAPATGCDSAAE